VESDAIAQLKLQKEELLNKVGTLKTELQEWRQRLDGQVSGFKGVSSILEIHIQLMCFDLQSPCHDGFCHFGHACNMLHGMA